MAALGLFIGGCGPVTIVPYDNQEYGIRLQHPSNWEILEGHQSSVVTLVPPQGRPSDNFVDNLHIVIQRSPVSLETWVSLVSQDLINSDSVIEIIENEPTVLAGNVAHRFIYTAEDYRGVFKYMAVWMVSDDVVYGFSYTARGRYDDFLEDVQKIIGSFEITSSRPPALFESEPSGFSTYENEEYGIKTVHPSNWSQLEDFGNTMGVAFFAPDSNTSFNILVDNASGITLQDYTELTFALLEASIPGFTIIDSSEATLDGNIARRIIYTGSDGFENMEIQTVRDETAYVLSYRSKDNYETFLNTAYEIIDSFEIISDPIQFLTYENTEHEIGVQYPSNWQILEIGDEDEEIVVSFFRVGQRGSITGVAISVADVFQLFPEYTERRLQRIEEMGFSILDSSSTTLAGNFAHNVTYTEADGAKHMEIWTVNDFIVYVIAYVSESESDYEFFLDTAQRMIDSFEITSP